MKAGTVFARWLVGVKPRKEIDMLSWAFMFLIIAIVAGVLGLSGVAGTAANIAWILFVVGLIAAIVFGLMGRSRGAV